MPEFTTPELIAEAERELKQRVRVYARLVAAGKLAQKTSDRQLDLQRAIIAKLRQIDVRERLL